MANIKTAFSAELASAVLSEIWFRRSNYYNFLAKTDPWDLDDDTPPANIETPLNNINTRNDMVYLKRIAPNDVTMVVPKYVWATGTVYARWDDSLDMSEQEFYCMTNVFNVFKCIDNNNGIASTVAPIKPVSAASGPFKTSDGYTWQYMYHVPFAKRDKFITTEYMPVQRALADSFYNKGSVNDVVVINGGSGYTDTILTTIYVNGIGSGAILIPILSKEDKPGMDAGTIIGVKIQNGGTGYDQSTTLTVNDANGSGSGLYPGNAYAVLKPIVVGGAIVNVTVEDPGKNYSVGTNTIVSVVGDGDPADPARVSVTVVDGVVINAYVENPGIGYTHLVLTVSSLGPGTGAILQPKLGQSDFISDQHIVEQTSDAGGVYAIAVTSGGTGYTTPTVYIDSSAGTGATASAQVTNGVISRIIVDTLGSNYTNPTVRITDPNIFAAGATARVIAPPTGGHGKDAVAELFGKTVLISTTIQQNSDTLLNKIRQEYRQHGIIKDLAVLTTNKLYVNESALVAYEVRLSDDSDISTISTQLANGTGDVLMSSDLKSSYRIIALNGRILSLQPISTTYSRPFGLLRSTEIVDKTYDSIEVISEPTIDKQSGKLLYVSNEAPFLLNETQGIVLNTFLKF